MSRETDSSSSGPQGRGGAAYPSGTPPYGPRPFPSLHPQERPRTAGPEQDGAEAAEPGQDATDEPRTETTLTTRIRINIPGSRPIPPVVMRTTVEEGAAAAGPQGSGAPDTAGPAGAAAAPAEEPAADGGQGGDAQQERAEKKEKTSDWFAPRKSVGPAGPGTGAGAGSGAGPGGAGPAPAGFTQGTGGGATGDGFSEGFSGDGFQGDLQGGGAPGGSGTSTGGFTVPPVPPTREGSAPGAPGSQPVDGYFGTGTPAGGTPAAPRTGDLFAGPYDEQFADPDTGTQQIPQAFLPPPVGAPFDGGPAARGPHDTPSGGYASPFETPPGAEPGAGASPFGTEGFPPGVPRGIPTDPFGRPAPPSGATTGPATGEMRVPPLGGDTGEHAFRPPSPAGSQPPGGRGAGDTLVGGIAPVPAGEVRPRPAGPGSMPPAGPPPFTGSGPQPETATPAAPAASAPKSAKPVKKGRSKLVLLGTAVGGAVVIAYGAGLLMNHSDVPKGTTVLGVDIGNTSQESAVKTLDHAIGNRGTAPLTVTVDGKQHTLKPSIAGLSIDTDATVRKVAHSDYNPVSVIGSLFGRTRAEDPVIVIDQDKLKAALKSVAGNSSTASEGMVRFSDGKAVAVPGKPGQSVDVDAAATQVSAAYRLRAQTGRNTPIDLKGTTVQPKVTQAELTKAVNGFGKTAMQGPVFVSAGGGRSVEFDSTLSQFLTMQATPDGKLSPHIDLKVLQSLYGGAFDGVLLERGNGSKTAVTPQDVATALMQGLNATSPAKRTVPLQDVAN
ncbi:hypothetical protein SAMN05216223_102152 [Actinacidiphila yanglinensis]|uniref:Peptidoglycan binding domain-containing protein n=1 Tax=Actinacidiphila yanglinensis TaxID=310779 RepID=A0A1H5V6L0_9ACTN|nr:hypothetical protein [Actinacidiphila yanglinensis]SEF82371.1 hypothetical protein SAMN05216223_102152 [Actinacidiphila yanglinensis]